MKVHKQVYVYSLRDNYRLGSRSVSQGNRRIILHRRFFMLVLIFFFERKIWLASFCMFLKPSPIQIIPVALIYWIKMFTNGWLSLGLRQSMCKCFFHLTFVETKNLHTWLFYLHLSFSSVCSKTGGIEVVIAFPIKMLPFLLPTIGLTSALSCFNWLFLGASLKTTAFGKWNFNNPLVSILSSP